MERVKTRLDKQLCPPLGLKPVQPKAIIDAIMEGSVPFPYELDADGNAIPDC